MTCTEAGAFAHAYVDAELAGVERDSFENHLRACPACAQLSHLQARFKAAVRGHLPRPEMPAGLEDRVRGALAAAPAPPRRWLWPRTPRVAVAAAAVVAVFLTVQGARARRSPFVEQALRLSHAEMPMDVVDRNCARVASWFRGKVDFTVPAAPLVHPGPCRGGRLVNVGDRLGAYFVYDAPRGHGVRMMVFDAGGETLTAPRRRVVGGRDVYFGTAHGASLAAFRGRDGLGYVMTTDLDEDALSGLVEAAFGGRRVEAAFGGRR